MPITVEAARAWIERCAAVLAENAEYLTQLDAAIGDADHGVNMDRGFRTALGRLQNSNCPDIGTVFKTVGMALVSTVGGAAGPLYGTFFLQLGTKTAGKQELTPEEWGDALDAAVKAVMARGQAQPQDKTMVDALLPAVEAYRRALSEGADFATALERAAAAAEEGMRATIPLVARKGRASYLGERSAGHQDPGATSSALILRAAADTWRALNGPSDT